jgi:hypothetical protein
MRWMCLTVAIAFASSAFAQPPPPADEPPRKPQISGTRRAAAIAAAVIPGLIVRGAGSWVAKEERAAKRIFIGAVAGLAVGAAAGGLVGGTGGNPYTLPAVPIVLAGAGMFLTSWLADIYVAAGGGERDARPRATPPWSVEAGTTWLHDAYRERALLRGAGRVEVGRTGLGAGTLVDAGGDALIAEGDVRVRILGAPATGEPIACGNRLVARAGYRFHGDDSDRVTQHVGELELIGRVELAPVDRAFRHSFLEGAVGIGAVNVEYSDMTSETDSVLLGRFAWGLYLGERGEAQLFYDHRRDGLAGGIAADRAAGFVGSVGASVDLRVSGPWALRGELQIGTAWVSTLAVGYRGGAR